MAEKLAKISNATEALAARYAEQSLSDVDDVQERIGQEILAADSVEAILDGGQATQAEDILGQSFTIHGFQLRPSDKEAYPDGPDYFAVMDVSMTDTGEVLAVTCGAFNVMTALLRIEELGGFPREVCIKTAGRALRLYRPDHEVVEIQEVGKD